MDPSHTRYTPEITPPSLRGLLFALGLGGICSGLFFRTAALTFGLSYSGLVQGKIWQLATYPFILGSSLSWWSLLILALEVLFLWVYSASIIEQKGAKSFSFLILGSTLFAGLATLPLQSPAILIGMAPLFLAIWVTWMKLHPGATLLLLGFSVKASVLITSFIGFDLLIHLSQEDWVPLIANGSGALFGYLYCKLPFLARSRSKTLRKAKIYDIRSGKPVLSDDRFMDAMLARISLHGESSLSTEEKKRMQQISQKCRQEE
jgi:hypothetical protein